MPQETNLCFDYSTGTVCKGRTECKYKRVRYHRFLDTTRVEPNTGTSTRTQVVTSIFPQTKAVLTPKQIYNFNPGAYYKTINAQVGQLLMNNFPWGVKDVPWRRAPFNTGSVGTTAWDVNDPNATAPVTTYQYVQLPPNKYEFRYAPLTGKAAFMKWYEAFASGQVEPGKKWPIIFSHLTENWGNYTDPGSKADDILKKMQLLIQQAFSGIIVLNATP